MSKVKILQRPSDIIEIKSVIPSIIERMDYASKNNFTGEIVPGYTRPLALLQESAVHALAKVQEDLSKNQLGLIIYDAYRPHKSVEFFSKEWKNKEDLLDIKNKYYPNKTKDQLFQEGFLSKQSSHSRGSTVDLSIINLASKEEIDMGSIFDFFDETSFSFSDRISDSSKQARIILIGLMEKHGFINYHKEWWHFSYVDEKYNHFFFDFDI